MTHQSRKRFLYFNLAALALGAIHGCGTNSMVDDASTGNAMTDEPSCPDTCAPQPPDWNGPTLLWSGPLWGGTDVPSCPADAPNIIYEGYADLIATTKCEACKCEPSTGACSLLSTITLYMSEIACTPSPIVYPFDPPPNWDGSCTAGDAIAPHTYNTITFGPHHLTNESCAPVTPIPEIKGYPPHWDTYALACGISAQCIDDKTCIKSDRTSDEFLTCVFREGIATCPEDYPVQHVFHNGFDDQRGCSACECGPPVGSNCSGMVKLYEDSECKDSFLELTIGAKHSQTACASGPDPYPMAWPFPVGSKSADPVTYKPGTCAASGGDLMGEAVPTGPTTFCCRDSL